MSGLVGSSTAPLDLALPGAQRSVQHWVGTVANKSGPPLRSAPAVHPEVVLAGYKPRLTRPELLARSGVVAAAPGSPARPNVSVVGLPEAPTPRRERSAALRLVQRLALLVALAMLAGMPWA